MQRSKQRLWFKLLPLLAMFALLLSGCSESMIVLDPKGPIGEGQKDLIYFTSLLCLIILVPVLALTAFIVIRYREKPGSKATYLPDWAHNNKLEAIWWGIPIIIIAIIAVVTVKGAYELEPSKPLVSDKKPVVIQATSLDWKWLFTYPEQGIATVNYLYIPEDTPIEFRLTSDAPMNSFWIPQLGGQIYTMSGMAMKLHLQADEPGVYLGSGANFSGEHFAKMRFDVHATSQAEFDKWVNEVKKTPTVLTRDGYEELAKPGIAEELSYSSFPEGLFDSIVTKYAVSGTHGAHGMHGGHAPVKSEETTAEADSQDSHGSHESHDNQEAHESH
jgi:cytochrome o ubiquinol oxidase subunit II